MKQSGGSVQGQRLLVASAAAALPRRTEASEASVAPDAKLAAAARSID